MGCILGLDWGLKKVGVATADPKGVVITPQALLRRKNAAQIWSLNADDKEQLKKLFESYEPDMIVLGQPELSGSKDNPSSLASQNFAKKLAEWSGLKVALIPETLSSWEAKTITQKNQAEDSVAAGLILRDYFARIK